MHRCPEIGEKKSDDRLLKDMRHINADPFHLHVPRLPLAPSSSFLVHTWDILLQEDPVLIATLPQGLSWALCCFSLTLEYFWWNGAFNKAYALFSCSWVPSEVATQIPTLSRPVASFGLGFFPVKLFVPISCSGEENEVSAHFFLFSEYLSFWCHKLFSDDQQPYCFYRPEVVPQHSPSLLLANPLVLVLSHHGGCF